MKNRRIINEIIRDNFGRMKYVSLLLLIYAIIILITDFAPTNLWDKEIIHIYRKLDIIFAIIALFSFFFFWFYQGDNYKLKNIAIMAVLYCILVWSAVITGVEFNTFGFSTLAVVLILAVFFIYINFHTSILFFASTFLALGVTLYVRNQLISSSNELLFIALNLTIFSILIARRNYIGRRKDLLQSFEMLELNKELRAIKNKLEISNKDLQLSNKELYLKKEKLEVTIKELNDTQTKLVQSEKMASIGILAAGIAHEVNNPLNFINSSLVGLKNNLNYLSGFLTHYGNLNEKNYKQIIEDLNKKEVSFEEVLEMFKKAVEIIEVGVERTTKIIKALKSFVQNSDESLETYNLHYNLDITLLILSNKAKDRIKFKKEYGEIPPLFCYPGLINQVLMNVLSNSVEAIKGNGEITVITQLSDSKTVKIMIRDTGSGISEQHKRLIFDPFFTTKEVGLGTGVGLSISYNIIKEHKGSISVESEVGKGSTFIIELPVKQRLNSAN